MKKISVLSFGILVSVQCLTAQTTTFNYTGSLQTYTVPACVTSIKIESWGAQGGNSAYSGANGGYTNGIINVIAAQVFYLYVGGQGGLPTAGYNGGGIGGSTTTIGGGGGGASDVRLNGTTLTDRIMVAAGGGASGGYGGYSPQGGAGGTGNFCGTPNGYGGAGGVGGCASGGDGGCVGGTAPSYGTGGAGGGMTSGGGIAGSGSGVYGTAGVLGVGGNGGNYATTNGGGGGGGGYYGGSGGMSGSGGCNGGGGGGSSYINNVSFSSQVFTGGIRNGNGQIIVTVMTSTSPPSTPGVITGSSSICANASGNYSIVLVPSATTYTWTVPVGAVINSGQGTNTINATFGSSSGNITVTSGNACGTSAASTFALTISPPPAIIVSSNPASVCSGGTSTLTASGGSTYVWMPGNLTGASVVVTPLIVTTYTVTGTSAAGCVNTATTTVTVNPLPTVTASSSPGTFCVGGSSTLTANGATTYAWMPGNLTGASITVSPTATTTYTVTGTNANGCINTATRTITVNPLPIVTATSTSAAVCTGASVTLTGGGASTYVWSGGVTNAVSFIPTATTTYTVTGTNANGCVNTATITVTVNPLPVVTATSTAAAVCVGGNVTLTGGGATSYTWSGGVTNGLSFIPTATATYTVTGTNANGCVNTATITVTVNPLPVVTATSTAAAVCAGASVTLTGGGATTYAWSGGVTDAVIFIPTATTTYTVTGTNINGCVNTATITVTVNPLPVVTATSTAPSICLGGSVILAANGASNYNWMPGNLSGFLVSVSPTATTTYTVTGTDANACVNTATITVIVNVLPVVTATSTAPSICIGGSVTLAANGASSYNWMPGNLSGFLVSVSPTATTTYTVTGTDANACVNTATITVIVNVLPVVTATSTAPSICIGGSVTLAANGASSYNWMPGNLSGFLVSVSPSATTTYTVTGTDANACVNTAMTTVTVNPLPIVTANSSAASVCTGGSVTLTGGGASTYNWNNNVIDAISFVPTATTTYMVTGTDANGCVNTAMTTVTVNPLPTVTATSSAASVCTGGSVTLTGGGAATYVWDNNVIDAVSFVPTATTTYMVTGTDVNGCVNTAMTTVTLSGLLTVSLGPDIIQCGGTALLDAGNMGSTFLWNNASTTQTITVSASGTYIVVVTDVNGCNGSDTAVVTINSNPSVSAAASSVVVCVDDANVTLIGTPTGGVWSGPGVNGLLLNPTAAGVGLQSAVYSYTDVNGCEGMDSVNVQVNACVGLVENILANGVSVYPNPNNGSFTLSVNANVIDLAIKITDIQGRVVYASVENNVNAGFVKQISLDTQSSGMFLMHILVNGEQQTKKIAVQK